MKLLIQAAIIFLPLAASASGLAVGDKIVYFTTWDRRSDHYHMEGTITWELTAYNSAKDTWTKTTSIDMPSTHRVTHQLLKSDEIFQEEDIKSYLTHCSEHRGTLEKLKTSIGVIDACKVQTKRGFAWVADVPMGAAKMFHYNQAQDADYAQTVQSVFRGPMPPRRPVGSGGEI